MKRLISILSALAFVLGLTQCAKTNLQEPDVNDKIHVTFTNTVETRSEIQDVIGSVKFYWEDGDKVWAYDGTKCLGSLSIREADIGKEFATFEGTISTPSGNKVKFFYFGSAITAPQTASCNVDYHDQDGKLTTLKEKLIASCEVTYTPGQTLFSGTFAVPFAIGKFKFYGTDFSEGEAIHVKGLMQTITVSYDGSITYGAPATTSSELIYHAATLYYIAMPSEGAYNKVSFYNKEETRVKKFDKAIVNNIYYHATNGAEIDVMLSGFFNAELPNMENSNMDW